VCDCLSPLLSLNSLSQLYAKIFMPALPVSDILSMKCIHYTVKRTILCNNFKKYTFSGCLYVSAAGKVSSKSGKPKHCVSIIIIVQKSDSDHIFV